jgi:hypothetical protein
MDVIPQMKLLISLAQIDGTIAPNEKNYVLNIGRANGLDEQSIKSLFEERHPVVIPNNLTSEEKFNYIFSLVQLMKIDERMYKEEILFCSKIASTLGYDKQVMFDLMMHVKGTSMEKVEIDSLKEMALKYLN